MGLTARWDMAHTETIARLAYKIADAMVAKREEVYGIKQEKKVRVDTRR